MRDFNVVASRDYLSASTQVGEITVNSYFLPGDEEGGRQALDWAAQALTIYQKEFGAYPYRELDIVETATTAGGIEYPGLVVVASRLYSDANRKSFFESATVHEVAHQWWYNVVGNDQVNHPWLDEALTQYATYRYFQDAYGDAGGQTFIESLDSRWAAVGREDKPIGLPAGDYTAKEYGRGPLCFLALRDRLGPDKMAELLRRYYAEQAWDIATPEELRALAEEVAGTSLEDLWAEWVSP
jgi:aminopeptidase N